jgi:nucleotide sugar dehydrogenase
MTAVSNALVARHSSVPPRPGDVAVLGLGYVGLPTALALHEAGLGVLGIDISETRLAGIRAGAVDLLERDRARLAHALDSGRFGLSTESAALGGADAVIIAVPTPVDGRREPDLRALESACAATVRNARRGQTLVLTSTTYVGTTRDLLVAPLAGRGLIVGEDIHVAFAPERINPGDPLFEQAAVPRVLGGATAACAHAAAALLAATASTLHTVSSIEAAELTKLQENTFRAVNLALANELATAAGAFGVDPVEVVDAAATKPYGYLPHLPGPGIGGHCIPVDPYYLLAPLRAAGVDAPLIERAMEAVARRPREVAERALAATAARGIADADARILVVGAAYKPGVADCRSSPACEIATQLTGRGAHVAYYDPLVHDAAAARDTGPDVDAYDLVLVAVTHPGHDYGFLDGAPHVLDATYTTPGGRVRHAL